MHKKSLGQNWLTCTHVIDKIIEKMANGPKRATELGPGEGAITNALFEAEYSVKAIEKDVEMIDVLGDKFPQFSDASSLIEGDLKDEDWSWDEPWQLVGNIPYYLSGLIIRKLTQLEKPPEQAIFLIQKEVGERIVAQEPNMSLISLSIGLWGNAEKIMNVSRSCFKPQPKVDSQLIMLTPRDPVPEREKIMQFARPIFQQKRKQVGGSLKKVYKFSHPEFSTQRPQELSIKQWIELYTVYTDTHG